MPGTVIQTSVIGAALVEILNGELSDETIAAIAAIKRDDIPPPMAISTCPPQMSLL